MGTDTPLVNCNNVHLQTSSSLPLLYTICNDVWSETSISRFDLGQSTSAEAPTPGTQTVGDFGTGDRKLVCMRLNLGEAMFAGAWGP